MPFASDQSESSVSSSAYRPAPPFDFFRLVVTTGAVACVLLLPSLLMWIFQWRWAPDGDHAWITLALAVTNTAGFPYACATCVALAALFAWRLKSGGARDVRSVAMCVVLCAAAVVCSLGLKEIVKNSVREPRPYAKWIEANYGLKTENFYALPRSARAEQVRQNIEAGSLVAAKLQAHWKAETGYSFPSGHASFVALWALLGIALLWPRGDRKICAGLIAWALVVECSRLVLGMHWPGDLAMAVLLNWLVALGGAVIWEMAKARVAVGSKK